MVFLHLLIQIYEINSTYPNLFLIYFRWLEIFHNFPFHRNLNIVVFVPYLCIYTNIRNKIDINKERRKFLSSFFKFVLFYLTKIPTYPTTLAEGTYRIYLYECLCESKHLLLYHSMHLH